jgi:Ca2+-binding RTX toxin-like protein
VLVTALCLPAVAGATTVKREYGGRVDGEKVDIVTVTAAKGERNDVTVSVRLDGRYTLTKLRDATAPLKVRTGCRRTGSHTATCRGANDLGQVKVNLRDGDDRATVGSQPDSYRLYYFTTVDGGDGDDYLDADDGAERMSGGSGNDILRGSSDRESMNGGTGRDTLDGRKGGDFLQGGPGYDVLRGGEGNDNLLGGLLEPGSKPAGRDRLYGGDGDDALEDSDLELDTQAPQVGRDVLDGGSGEDDLDSYRWRTEPVFVDLRMNSGNGQSGEDDSISGFETVIGGLGDDVLIGDDLPNWLDGRDGSDEVRGRGGGDLVFAWDDDAVYGDAGGDDIRTVPEFAGTLECGSGDDVVRLDVFLGKPFDLPGPHIEDACERLTNGSTFSIDPVPAASADGDLTFEIVKARVDGLTLSVTEPTAPYTELASARIEGQQVTVEPPARPLLRAIVTPLGNAPFAWQFVVSG